MRSSILASFLWVALLGACDKSSAGKAEQQPTPADTAAKAEPPAATPVAGKTYGAGVSTDGSVASVTIDQLLADPAAYEGKTVRVEGMVTDVCPKRGCWMDLAGSGPGDKVRFKVDDGVMTFPMEAKGSVAMAQGTVAVQRLTLEESRAHARHQAEEYGAAVDPESITEPMVVVRIDGTGAVIRE